MNELALFKHWLREELKRLRAENDAQYPERYDLDITPSCQGYEAALDDFEELLDDSAERRPNV